MVVIITQQIFLQIKYHTAKSVLSVTIDTGFHYSETGLILRVSTLQIKLPNLAVPQFSFAINHIYSCYACFTKMR